MRVSPSANVVRELVCRTFRTLSFRKAARSDLNETILIDEGRCVGRSYRAGGLMAMWMVEVGLVQFYDAEGNMLQTVNLFEGVEPQRMAA
ncbi:MAG TPA: hypothetical protein VND64_31440 [Pirellulales bacterium]|nr:hypothetical protein [Pirellulales bacterium]